MSFAKVNSTVPETAAHQVSNQVELEREHTNGIVDTCGVYRYKC